MTAPRVIGRTDAVRKADVRRWSRDSGQLIGARWEGTKEAIERLEADLRRDGGADSIDTNFNGAKHELTAWYGNDVAGVSPSGQSENIVTWELDPLELQNPTEQHPHFESIPASRKKEILNAVEEDPTNTAGITYSSLEDELRRLLLAGIRNYRVDGFLVRKTTVTSWRSSVRASFTGVGHVSSSLQLGTSAKFTLPAGEYLKTAPSVRRMGKRKFEIQEMWLHAEKWLGIFYPGGTGTVPS